MTRVLREIFSVSEEKFFFLMESVCLRVCFIWFEDLNPVHKQRGVAKAQNVPGEDVEEF